MGNCLISYARYDIFESYYGCLLGYVFMRYFTVSLYCYLEVFDCCTKHVAKDNSSSRSIGRAGSKFSKFLIQLDVNQCKHSD